MLSRKNKIYLFKILSLFSVVRGYNILIIILAQYLTAIFIITPNRPYKDSLLDLNLFLMVAATAMVIAAGYIINNFYDAEKDLINKPFKSMLDRLVSQEFKLKTYFILNLFGVLTASYISFKAVLFFSAYIFGIWVYSHKIKKILAIGNLASALLAVMPFFVILVYYKNYYPVIFVHAAFLFLLILIREIVKDLENLKGDMAQDYPTIPAILGIKVAKISVSLLTLLTIVPIYQLIFQFDLGYMQYFFIVAFILLALFNVLLWHFENRTHFVSLHNLLKFIIVAGVLSIMLLDIEFLLKLLRFVET